MQRDKGLQIIQQLLRNATIVEKQSPKIKKEKSGPPSPPQDPAARRYIRTPENDGRFAYGDTYRDTHTDRICWMPEGVDPNDGE